jgi:putative acetyltransferase
MPDLQKTDSNNPGFITLVKLLDEELRCRYGQLQDFYGQFNKIDNLKNVICGLCK